MAQKLRGCDAAFVEFCFVVEEPPVEVIRHNFRGEIRGDFADTQHPSLLIVHFVARVVYVFEVRIESIRQGSRAEFSISGTQGYLIVRAICCERIVARTCRRMV